MKKILAALVGMLLAASAAAGPNSLIITQRNSADTGNILRTLDNPATDGLLIWNKTTSLPSYLTLGAGLSVSNGVLSASSTAPGQVNADWNSTSGLSQILNKPVLKTVAMTGQAADLTGLSGVALSGSYADLANKPILFSGNYADLAGRPSLFSGNWSDLSGKPNFAAVATSGAYADLTGRPTLAAVATSGNYNDLTNKPAAVTYAFDFGAPAARTYAVSTAYQATTPTKAAIVTVSPSCAANLSLAGGSTCTMQARVGIAPLNCSSGVVIATWSNGNTGTLTIGLGLTQTVGSPYGINLPAGASFILCPVSGTFTVSAAEQTAG